MSAIARLKRLTKKTLMRARIPQLVGSLRHPHSAVILRYHSIVDDPEDQAAIINPGITHSTEMFRRHMRILSEHFHPITLNDIASFRTAGQPLPPRSVAVTFDDGFADNYHIAASIMEEYGIRGAVYVTVDCIEKGTLPWFCRIHYAFHTTRRRRWEDTVNGKSWDLSDPGSKAAARRFFDMRCASTCGGEQAEIVAYVESSLETRVSDLGKPPRMLNWNEARHLLQRGHIIGNHTMTHPNLAHLSDCELQREITDAHRLVEQQLGIHETHFSYPHPCLEPHWTENSLSLTQVLGYKTGVTTDYGIVNSSSDRLRLPRIHVPKEEMDFVWALYASGVGVKT